MPEQRTFTIIEALESVSSAAEIAALKESEARLIEMGEQSEPYEMTPYKGLSKRGEDADVVRAALQPRASAIARLKEKLVRGDYVATGLWQDQQGSAQKSRFYISWYLWDAAFVMLNDGKVIVPVKDNRDITSSVIVSIEIIAVYADSIGYSERLPPSHVWHWSQAVAWIMHKTPDPVQGSYRVNLSIAAARDVARVLQAVPRAVQNLVHAVSEKRLLRLNPNTGGYTDPAAFTYNQTADCIQQLTDTYKGRPVSDSQKLAGYLYFENIRFRRDDVMALWPVADQEAPAPVADMEAPAPDAATQCTMGEASIRSKKVHTKADISTYMKIVFIPEGKEKSENPTCQEWERAAKDKFGLSRDSARNYWREHAPQEWRKKGPKHK